MPPNALAVRDDHVHAAEPLGVLLHPGGQRGVIAGVDRGTDHLTVRTELPAGQLDLPSALRAQIATRIPSATRALHHSPADPAAARGHQGLA